MSGVRKMVDHYKRSDRCREACNGLTEEQVAALPRLVAWFRDGASTTAAEEEYRQLRRIYPKAK